MKYTREELSKCTIYSLRDIGRPLGVKCVSKFIKKDLIDEILAVQNGEKAPHFTNVGRPTLSSIAIQENERVIEKKEKPKFKTKKEKELDNILEQFKNFILKYTNK